MEEEAEVDIEGETVAEEEDNLAEDTEDIVDIAEEGSLDSEEEGVGEDILGKHDTVAELDIVDMDAEEDNLDSLADSEDIEV